MYIPSDPEHECGMTWLGQGVCTMVVKWRFHPFIRVRCVFLQVAPVINLELLDVVAELFQVSQLALWFANKMKETTTHWTRAHQHTKSSNHLEVGRHCIFIRISEKMLADALDATAPIIKHFVFHAAGRFY
jgi:hypothetical protein